MDRWAGDAAKARSRAPRCSTGGFRRDAGQEGPGGGKRKTRVVSAAENEGRSIYMLYCMGTPFFFADARDESANNSRKIIQESGNGQIKIYLLKAPERKSKAAEAD